MIKLDDNIIKRCLEKDKKAQMRLYETFYKRIYNSCYRLLRDQFEAEDAMQESFIKAFMKLEQYDRTVPFETWLVRIAINTSIDKLRENKIDWVDLHEEMYYPEEEDLSEMEDIYERAEEIKRSIRKMTGINQIILSLYLIEGYDHDEIAGVLKIKAATARVKYSRAKQELLKMLNNKEVNAK